MRPYDIILCRGDNLIIFGVLNYGKTMGNSWGVGELGTKA